MNAERLLQLYDRVSEAPDAIVRLRRFILNLAVRGKLVEQDPNDEPAGKLLKQLALGQAQLVANGAIRKPRELYPDQINPQPFRVPVSWCWVPLERVGAIVGGGTPSAANPENFADPGEGIPWLTPADLGGYAEAFIARGKRDLTEQGLQSSSATLMPAGTVLFTSRAPIGYVAIAGNAISTNQGFKSVVPYLGACSRFIALVLRTFAPEIDANAPGTTFKEVSGKIVAGVPFPLAPLSEQHRIVAKVDELMALCNSLEAKREKREATRDRLTTASLSRLAASDTDEEQFKAHADFAIRVLPELTTRPDQIKVLRQTILDLAVRGKLVKQDPNDGQALDVLSELGAWRAILTSQDAKALNLDCPYELPDSWSWTTLGTLVVDSDSGWSPRTENHARSGDAWGVLKVSAVSRDKFDPTENKQLLPGAEPKLRAQVHHGDFLISRANTAELIARAVIVDQQPVKLLMSDKIVRLRFVDLCNERFVLMVNNHASFARSYFASRATGVSPSMKNLSRTNILDLPIPFPPLPEQHRIVAQIDDLMTLCDQLERDLDTGQKSRSGLLEALLVEAFGPAITEAA